MGLIALFFSGSYFYSFFLFFPLLFSLWVCEFLWVSLLNVAFTICLGVLSVHSFFFDYMFVWFPVLLFILFSFFFLFLFFLFSLSFSPPLSLYFSFSSVMYGLWSLVRDWAWTSKVGDPSPERWTTRELPLHEILISETFPKGLHFNTKTKPHTKANNLQC